MKAILLLAMGVSIVSAVRAGEDVFFLPLGDLPGGIFDSVAYGVSADGQSVVGYSRPANENGANEAFIWRDGVMMGLGSLPGGTSGSFAVAVSGDGRVVIGGASNATVGGAVAWRDGVIELLSRPPGRDSTATDISDDGRIIVGYSRPNVGGPTITVGVVWTDGVYGAAEPPPGVLGFIFNAVSGDGAVAVGAAQVAALGTRAFKWNGEWTFLDNLTPFIGADAYAASYDGGVVAGLSYVPNSGENDIVRWNDTSAVRLERTELFGANACHGVSADGSVIVGGGDAAFVWTELDGTRRLEDVLYDDFNIDLGGWQRLDAAYDVSADGRTIVGFGRNATGAAEAFLARVKYRCTRTDLDFSFETNLVDLAILLAHFGECASDDGFLPVADIDRRGCVDLPDLAALLAEFGTACE